ncbi:MAG: N-6 DNA methylase [bacterium]
MKKGLSYNERSWAIDLISEINQYLTGKHRAIQRAGGEMGLSAKEGGQTLFPDVLLFGDQSQLAAIHGWELKMPDTDITDDALLKNAHEKCRRLGLSSFLVWNAVDAVLWRIDGDSHIQIKTWHCEGIQCRDDVRTLKASWIVCLKSILSDLNDYFEQGVIRASQTLPTQMDAVITSILDSQTGVLVKELKQRESESREARTTISIWWRAVKSEYAKNDQFPQLAKEILLHWIHRFLFAHYLRQFVSEALSIHTLEAASIQEAEKIFTSISSRHDFAQLFTPRFGSDLLPPQTWNTLLEFNSLLSDLKISEIDQSLLQSTLQDVRKASQRKLAGQFCTPQPLADLLVKLTVNNYKDPVLDPCCGTGTIARAAFLQKVAHGISPIDAVKSTWASERYETPLQFATLSLAAGEAPFETLRVFKHDVLTLEPNEALSFVDAKTGDRFSEHMPLFPSIVLNPPFIRFEDLVNDLPQIAKIRAGVAETTGEDVPGKADYFVPIILNLWKIVAPQGRIGAIFPNAWLGSNWGQAFRRIVQRFFVIESIITSGKSRWFKNAKIVTNVVVLQKRDDLGKCSRSDESICFGVTQKELDACSDEDTTEIADTISSKSQGSSLVRTNSISSAQLDAFDRKGLCWAAHFTTLDWWATVEKLLIPASSFFDIKRGERRGWDPLFYPATSSDVEADYLLPVVKTAANVKSLVAQPDGIAFCCSESLASLKAKGHTGAMGWINKFEFALNKKGKPLTKSLARKNRHWYEMRRDTTAHLAVSMNPDKRLFFMRLNPAAFVNQRLIRLTAKNNEVDIDLCHALLSSLLGCFYLEALGFGRGLGVLDLNASKIARQIQILNPSIVTETNRQSILKAFKVLTLREVLPFEREMQSEDRMGFEQIVFESFGLTSIFPAVQKSVMELHFIRHAARQ